METINTKNGYKVQIRSENVWEVELEKYKKKAFELNKMLEKLQKENQELKESLLKLAK